MSKIIKYIRLKEDEPRTKISVNIFSFTDKHQNISRRFFFFDKGEPFYKSSVGGLETGSSCEGNTDEISSQPYRISYRLSGKSI